MQKLLTVLAIGLTLSSAAHAELYTLHYTAKISSISQLGAFPEELPVSTVTIRNQVINLDDTVTGSYTFDTSASPIAQYNYGSGIKAHYGNDAPFGATVQFNRTGYKEVSSIYSSAVTVEDAAVDYGDTDFVRFDGNTYREDWVGFGLNFFDPTATALSAATIPTTELGQFNGAFYFGSVSYTPGVSSYRLRGELTSMSLVSAVPEPGTYAMLLAGLGLLAWRRKRA
ncbi:PEP-CTERM sorting domain-containing protein [Pseudoduganella chitinolytica]|uniref:PEP-CTERM sorting domain-containing protein n=1 Tax=Pseudoduganella chitinolytica TaxID=34070 RepID=A0ABY8B9K7_9BURK|nr:PEP-CTERM sorting domain-containing protein [Pseudoduganella chitinolytica]WEF31054.1 PEP-CTERM sorting domain-containing protein [Pseudoduganella chitinolytica]